MNLQNVWRNSWAGEGHFRISRRTGHLHGWFCGHLCYAKDRHAIWAVSAQEGLNAMNLRFFTVLISKDDSVDVIDRIFKMHRKRIYLRNSWKPHDHVYCRGHMQFDDWVSNILSWLAVSLVITPKAGIRQKINVLGRWGRSGNYVSKSIQSKFNDIPQHSIVSMWLLSSCSLNMSKWWNQRWLATTDF